MQLINTDLTKLANFLSNSPFVIRTANIDDLELILKFTLKLHDHENDKIVATHDRFEKNLEKWLIAELSNPQSLFLVAIVNDILPSNSEIDHSRTIGFVGATSIINDNGFLKDPIKGVINLLWVEEKYRKLNIAKSLIENIEECFKNIGINYFECTYTNNNQLARKFWNELGYQCHAVMARKISN